MSPAGSSPIRVLVVDDHPLLRDGVAAVLALQPDMELVGEAQNGREAVDRYIQTRPNVVLMDLQMPEMTGVQAIEKIKAVDAQARIIVLTTFRGDAQAANALRAGAIGYLLKMSLRHELIAAIRAVHAGRRFVAADIAGDLAAHAADDALTQREVEVLTVMSKGAINRMIAKQLKMGEETVKSHLRSIYSKLGASDRTEAVAVALRRGIISL
jgi:DNA-binding NarL/FixJ family response regulator